MAYRPRDPDIVSRNMAAIRGRDNRTEVSLRKALFRRGCRYRLYASELPGTPDIVFPQYRTVVFVDGDYWHGRILLEAAAAFDDRFQTTRREWWRAKLLKTIIRDRETKRRLEALGWTVIRLWESDVRSDIEGAATKIEAIPGDDSANQFPRRKPRRRRS